MSDWYRRTDWNAETAADFEARLARARPSSRAQYLSLQGQALLAKGARDDWSLAGLEALAAEAMIRFAKGEGGASQLANEALQQWPDGEQAAVWAGISLDRLRSRLEAIAK